MKKTNAIAQIKKLVAASALLLIAGNVASSEFDGAKILEMEAQRAQELTELEHRAKVAEQQARIAAAEKRLREAGFVPTANGYAPAQSMGVEPVAPTGTVPGYSNTVDDDADFEVPKLKSINGRTAILKTKKYGELAVRPGLRIPDDFKVISVDANNGVTLQRHGVTYVAQVSWN